MISELPRCTITDLPRVMCGCPKHNYPRPKTAMERDLVESGGWDRDPPVPPPRPFLFEYLGDGWATGDDPLPEGLGVCDHDDKPPGMRLCPGCTTVFHQLLADIPALLGDLEITRTKQDHFLAQGAMLEDDPEQSQVPWKQGASVAIRGLWRALGGRPAPRARWLLEEWQTTLRHPQVEELFGRVGRACRYAHSVIDRRPTKVYYGQCPQCCESIMQERIPPDLDPPGQVVCSCGYRASLQAHQYAQLDLGEARQYTVSQLVHVLRDGGEPVERYEIDNLIHRQTQGVIPGERVNHPRWVDGKLMEHQVWVYRLGHIRTALLAQRIHRR